MLDWDFLHHASLAALFVPAPQWTAEAPLQPSSGKNEGAFAAFEVGKQFPGARRSSTEDGNDSPVRGDVSAGPPNRCRKPPVGRVLTSAAPLAGKPVVLAGRRKPGLEFSRGSGGSQRILRRCEPGTELTEIVDNRAFNGKVSVRMESSGWRFRGKRHSRKSTRRRAEVKARGNDAKGHGGTQGQGRFRADSVGDRIDCEHTHRPAALRLGGAIRPEEPLRGCCACPFRFRRRLRGVRRRLPQRDRRNRRRPASFRQVARCERVRSRSSRHRSRKRSPS